MLRPMMLVPMMTLAAALVLGGCRSDTAERRPLLGDAALRSVGLTNLTGEWELTSIDGTVVTPEVSPQPPTLTVEPDGRVHGFAGVNRYFAAVNVEKLGVGEFDLDGMGATRMAGPRDRMVLEAHYLDLLDTADRAALAGDGLQLSRRDVPVLIFRRVR